MTNKNLIISKKSIERAVQISSKIEGMSLIRAKKNTLAIKLLKQHGHAFSIQRQQPGKSGHSKK